MMPCIAVPLIASSVLALARVASHWDGYVFGCRFVWCGNVGRTNGS